MKYISLFAGIGGFDLALQRQGHECVYVNEWDKYAAQIYEKNFCNQQASEIEQDGKRRNGNANQRGTDVHNRSIPALCHVDTRSITVVSTDDIPEHDLLVGGFPCQAFSIAGKRRGFDEIRGTLFFEIARILKAKHTRYFILENVKGLLSHDNGRTFKTIISTLVELGYDLQWQVLNSKNHGVPQNRERVFIIGHLRGEPGPKVFPFKEDARLYSDRQGQISPTITQRYHKQGQSDPYIVVENPVAPTIRATQHKSGDNQTLVTETNMRIRRLTPMECERLQGFPDNWTAGLSDTQRYKCLGNAVTVNVVEEIVKRFF
jgi:DNA (cytosine-5)-methyltransferase 1